MTNWRFSRRIVAISVTDSDEVLDGSTLPPRRIACIKFNGETEEDDDMLKLEFDLNILDSDFSMNL
jgi:hypothetical protein